jgi:hypothetical protein
MALMTRAHAEAAQASERTARAGARTSKVTAYFTGLPRATGLGNSVRARVAASPEEWSVTQVACDVDTSVALLQHTGGLWCPVCGARYDRISGVSAVGFHG